MSEFRDNDLNELLNAAGGPTPDVERAYAQVQGRVRAARRRRAATLGAVACAALVITGVFALGRSTGPDRTRPGSSQTTFVGSTQPRLDNTTLTTIGTPTTVGTTTATATGPVPDLTVTSKPTSTETRAPTPSSTAGGSSGQQPGAPGSTSPAAPPPTVGAPPTSVVPTTAVGLDGPPTTPATNSTQTFIGIGGRITVSLQNGTLSLVSYQSTVGFMATVQHQSGSYVEVIFESGSHQTKARVDLEEGRMSNRFEESD